MKGYLSSVEAGKLLGFSRQTIGQLAIDGVLSSVQTRGQGRGKRRYFRPGEVRAFRAGGSDGARQWREERGIPHPKTEAAA